MDKDLLLKFLMNELALSLMLIGSSIVLITVLVHKYYVSRRKTIKKGENL